MEIRELVYYVKDNFNDTDNWFLLKHKIDNDIQLYFEQNKVSIINLKNNYNKRIENPIDNTTITEFFHYINIQVRINKLNRIKNGVQIDK